MAISRNKSDPSHLQTILHGMLKAVPIVLGYLPVGFAFGVLAEKAGISTFNALLMSLIVFAGSSQLIVVGLMAAGITPLSIILTTFVVNLRHMLMSAALSPFLQHWNKPALAGFAYELTDETFALHAARFSSEKPLKVETFVINFTSHAAWIVGTWLGVAAGSFIADVEPFALDYALPAMFIALLVMQIKAKSQIFAALFAGGISVALLLLGLGQWHVILGTIIGATFGVLVEQWNKT